jgi:hypothetical protein
MNTSNNFLKRYALVLFFPRAYLLSWWSLLVPQAQGGILPHGPALAALILIGLTEGRPGLSVWWKRVTNWRELDLVSGGARHHDPLQLGGASINLLLGATLHPSSCRSCGRVCSMLLSSAAVGEPGWTALRLPKLQERLWRPLLASTILGARAVWHLPSCSPAPSPGMTCSF